MKKFFSEFKKFITRGNVVDMAVGVIVGSSFTAIVNGLSNFILKPLINALLAVIFGKNSLSELHTYLIPAYLKDDAGNLTSEIDLTNSIYIDWGSFINAIINFFLIAFVLFTIVKIINRVRENQQKLADEIRENKLTKAQKKELKALGIKRTDKAAVAAYFAKKAEDAKIAEEKAKAEAEEKARLEREANPTTEDLLKKIIALIETKYHITKKQDRKVIILSVLLFIIFKILFFGVRSGSRNYEFALITLSVVICICMSALILITLGVSLMSARKLLPMITFLVKCPLVNTWTYISTNGALS